MYEGADEEVMQPQPGAGTHGENKDQSQNSAKTREKKEESPADNRLADFDVDVGDILFHEKFMAL